MLSVITSILSVAVKGLMAFFLPSKDEKLGQLEVSDKEHIHGFNEIKEAQDAAAAVKSGAAGSMLDDPDNRDKR